MYTVDDVAKRIGKSRRWVLDYVRRRPIGGKAGRTRLFTEEDLAEIAAELLRPRKPSQKVIDAAMLLPRACSPTESVIYFAEAGNYIKIGYSKNWKDRLRSLYGSSPLTINVLHVSPGTPAKERALHRKFAHCRAHGEWFHKSPDLLAYIDVLKQDGV